ncbi:MAG: J domain-containing protein [Chloroflexi bacterium]|nr:J domain-containing protein [Chloroflexota bacterium]
MARLDYDPANDYYMLLGVDSDADSATIQRAYRQKAKEYHPDLNPGEDAKEKFQRLNEAYNVLTDAELRRQYNGLRWRFTTYGRRSSSNPYDGTSFREETIRRASQWQQSRWEEVFERRQASRRARVEWDDEPGYWLHDFGLGALRPLYRGMINTFGSPYRYVLLLVATLVVLNAVFIAAGFVFADGLLFRSEIEPTPAPTITLAVPTQVPVISGAVPTLLSAPTITPVTQVINCDPRTSFNLPLDSELGSESLQQLWATITLPNAIRYEVRAYPLDEAVSVSDIGYIVLASRVITEPLNFAPVADLRPLPSVQGFYRFTLEITLSDGSSFTGCDVTID